MVIQRGDVWWAELGTPARSGPGYRRPVVVISSDSFNRSRIQTVLVAVLTSNSALAQAPGNFGLAGETVGLPDDSVVNVSRLTTIDKRALTHRAGQLPLTAIDQLDRGLRLALALEYVDPPSVSRAIDGGERRRATDGRR